jgi:decaprenylphospho-beta-D-ribofuranose 2-oxidase
VTLSPPSTERQCLTGWGRTRPAHARVLTPRNTSELCALIRQAAAASLIPRGLGRSYGDAAQLDGAAVIDLGAFDSVALDAPAVRITAGSGLSLSDILRVIVPAGFFLPVTPGTRNVTLGGAIAADVHGKNHHGEGSFARHVHSLQLVDGCGEVRELTPSGDPATAAAFWATAGGMGLTGVITEACFSLIPIETALISVDTDRHRDLDGLMAAMVEGDAHYRYSVAWVDSLHPAGRGVLTRGDHASVEQLRATGGTVAGCTPDAPLAYDPKALASAPPFLPGGLLNGFTVRAFNEAWYRKAPKHRVGELQAIAPFFHPLDGVSDWNRIYGPAGFLQYQFAVPDGASELVPRTLAVLRKVGAPSFLTVLKRFGPGTPGPLSFPQPGWTLAADVPAAVPGLLEALDALDEEVAAAGGRLYLAKDSRQSAGMLQRSYPRLAEWQQQRDRLDPRHVFSSDLARRLAIA